MKTQNSTKEQSVTDVNFHSFIIIGLLVVGLVGVYVPQLTARWDEPAAADTGGYAYIVDLDYWQRTQRQRAVTASTRFDLAADLNDFPQVVGDWQGQDMPDANQEVQILLDPEQYVRRLYRHQDGHYIWLSLIGGRSSQPFHPPDICYDADGWQYQLGSRAFQLNGGGEIYALWLEAQKQAPGSEDVQEHVVSYFYIFPDAQRKLADGIVLFKLTTGRIGDADETLAMHEDFVRALFH